MNYRVRTNFLKIFLHLAEPGQIGPPKVYSLDRVPIPVGEAIYIPSALCRKA
jgi:hypothetical protein